MRGHSSSEGSSRPVNDVQRFSAGAEIFPCLSVLTTARKGRGTISAAFLQLIGGDHADTDSLCPRIGIGYVLTLLIDVFLLGCSLHSLWHQTVPHERISRRSRRCLSCLFGFRRRLSFTTDVSEMRGKHRLTKPKAPYRNPLLAPPTISPEDGPSRLQSKRVDLFLHRQALDTSIDTTEHPGGEGSARWSLVPADRAARVGPSPGDRWRLMRDSGRVAPR
jgi:hypothetical protein